MVQGKNCCSLFSVGFLWLLSTLHVVVSSTEPDVSQTTLHVPMPSSEDSERFHCCYALMQRHIAQLTNAKRAHTEAGGVRSRRALLEVCSSPFSKSAA